MVLGVVLPYDLARSQGMRPITAAEGEMARRWQRRVLYGDWTHAGLMNWDTGHGFIRWQLRRYWALAGNGLLAMASSRRLAFGATARNQAKYVFDQSLRLYDRLAVTEGPLLGSTFYAIKNAASQPRLDPALTAARFASLATRAAVLGLGTMHAAPLPPAYGFDPDIRRLAVTTPTYSTAITQATAVGNGGAELSRLIDDKGVPLSGTGGNGVTSTAFGLRLVAGRRTILETQPGFTRYSPTMGRLSADVRPGGGGFTRIHSQTRAGSGQRQVTVAHDFTPTTIHVRRRIVGARGLLAQVRFPAYRTASFDVIRGNAAPTCASSRARAAPPAPRGSASACRRPRATWSRSTRRCPGRADSRRDPAERPLVTLVGPHGDHLAAGPHERQHARLHPDALASRGQCEAQVEQPLSPESADASAGSSPSFIWKDEPQPQPATTFGFSILNPCRSGRRRSRCPRR